MYTSETAYKEYEHTQLVLNKLNIKNLEKYTRLYNEMDNLTEYLRNIDNQVHERAMNMKLNIKV